MQGFPQGSGQHGHDDAFPDIVLTGNGLGHDRSGPGSGGCGVRLAPAQEIPGFYPQGQGKHFIHFIIQQFRQAEAFFLPCDRFQLFDVGFSSHGMDIGLLGWIIGNPLGVDTLVAVFPAILQTEIVIKHGLNEAIETQAVAQAMEHGKGYPVLPVGHVQHMVIRDSSADHAGIFTFCHQEGQIVVGIVIKSLFPHKSRAVIRQAFQRLVHSQLEQIPPDFP